MSSGVVLGASIHDALHSAAFIGRAVDGWVVTTDTVLRHLVARRTDEIRRLVAVVPGLAEPTPYRSRLSLPDGAPLEQVPFEVEAALREVAWRATRTRRRASARPTVWSDGLRAALSRTLDVAATAQVTRAGAAHFLLAVLSDPAHRAVRVFPSAQPQVLAGLPGSRLLAENDERHPRPTELIARASEGRSRRLKRPLERFFRLSPLWWEVQWARQRNTVRLDHTIMTIAHTVIAAGDDAELAGQESVHERLGNRRWNDPLWSWAVIDAEERAEAIALAARHPNAGTTHLLAGMLAAAPDEINALFDAVGAHGVAERIQEDLDRIPPAWPER